MIINGGLFSLQNHTDTSHKQRKIICSSISHNQSDNSKAGNNKTDSGKTDFNKAKKQAYEEFKEKVKEMLDPTKGMSEEEKAEYQKNIDQKIKNGEKLSDSEMQYIKINNPYIYSHILRVQMQRQALEDKLKNCRSKEEVEDIYNDSVSQISEKDPDREPLMAAYDNVTQEFKKSSQYKSLSQKTKEEIEENKEDGKDEKNENNKKDRMLILENSKIEEYKIRSKYLQTEEVSSEVNYMA